MDTAEAASVRVLVRFRPVNEREREEQAQTSSAQFECRIEGETGVVLRGSRLTTDFSGSFDRVFDSNASQEDVYATLSTAIQDTMLGINATILSYGQTGSGKTFTMFGTREAVGIIPRAVNSLFFALRNATDVDEVSVKMSFLEIYQEVVKDLLNPGNLKLRVRERPDDTVFVEGLMECYVTSEQDVFDLMQRGQSQRSVSATQMNEQSSRSHTLLLLSVNQKTHDNTFKSGVLCFADLAGSEKVKKTAATGKNLEEAKKINQSLSALGNCIMALTTKKHVPYRDSKLTYILKNSLGGNAKTILLVTCSPHIFNGEETMSSLRFAQRAKMIKNTVVINRQRSAAELLVLLQRTSKQLQLGRTHIRNLQNIVQFIHQRNLSRSASSTALTSKVDAQLNLPPEMDSMLRAASVFVVKLSAKDDESEEPNQENQSDSSTALMLSPSTHSLDDEQFALNSSSFDDAIDHGDVVSGNVELLTDEIKQRITELEEQVVMYQEVVQEEAERSSQRQSELTREADEFESAFFTIKRKHDEIKSELDKANQLLTEEQQKAVALKQSFDADLSTERKRSDEEHELLSTKLALMEKERTDALNRATELEKCCVEAEARLLSQQAQSESERERLEQDLHQSETRLTTTVAESEQRLTAQRQAHRAELDSQLALSRTNRDAQVAEHNLRITELQTLHDQMMAEQNARFQEEQAAAQQLQTTLNEAHRIEVDTVRDQASKSKVEFESKLASLNAELLQKDVECKQALEQSRSKASELTDMQLKFTMEVNNLNGKLADMLLQNQELSQKAKQSDTKVKETDTMLQIKSAEIQDLIQRLQSTEFDLLQHKQSNEQQTQELAQLRDQFAASNSTITELNAAVSNKDIELNALRTRSSELQLQVEISDRQFTESQQALQQCQTKVQTIEQELESKAAEFATQLNAVNTAKNEATLELDRVTQSYQSKMVELTVQHQSKLSELESGHESALQQLTEQHQRHSNELVQSAEKQRHADQQQHSTQLETLEQKWKDELSTVQTSHAAVVKELQDTLTAKTTEFNSTRTELENSRLRMEQQQNSHNEAVTALQSQLEMNLSRQQELHSASLSTLRADFEVQLKQLHDQHEKALDGLEKQHQTVLSDQNSKSSQREAELKQNHEIKLQQLNDQHATALNALRTDLEHSAQTKLDKALSDAKHVADQQLSASQSKLAQSILEQDESFAKQMTSLKQTHQLQCTEFQHRITELQHQCSESDQRNQTLNSQIQSLQTQVTDLNAAQQAMQVQFRQAEQTQLEKHVVEKQELNSQHVVALQSALAALNEEHALKIQSLNQQHTEELNRSEQAFQIKLQETQQQLKFSAEADHQACNQQFEQKLHSQQQSAKSELEAMILRYEQDKQNQLIEYHSKKQELVSKLETEMSALVHQHEDALDKMRSKHSVESKNASNELAQLKSQHAQQLAQLNTEHDLALEKAKDELTAQHQKAIQMLESRLTETQQRAELSLQQAQQHHEQVMHDFVKETERTRGQEIDAGLSQAQQQVLKVKLDAEAQSTKARMEFEKAQTEHDNRMSALRSELESELRKSAQLNTALTDQEKQFTNEKNQLIESSTAELNNATAAAQSKVEDLVQQHAQELVRVRSELEHQHQLHMHDVQTNLEHQLAALKLSAAADKVEAVSLATQHEQHLAQLAMDQLTKQHHDAVAEAQKLHTENMNQLQHTLALEHDHAVSQLKQSHQAELALQTQHASTREHEMSNQFDVRMKELVLNEQAAAAQRLQDAVTAVTHKLSAEHVAAMTTAHQASSEQLNSISKQNDVAIEALNAEHANQVAEMQRQHQDQIKALTQKSELSGEEIKQLHQQQLDSLKSQFANDLDQLKSQHEQKLLQLQTQKDDFFKNEIEALTQRLESEKSQLQLKLDEQTQQHAQELESFKQHLENELAAAEVKHQMERSSLVEQSKSEQQQLHILLEQSKLDMQSMVEKHKVDVTRLETHQVEMLEKSDIEIHKLQSDHSNTIDALKQEHQLQVATLESDAEKELNDLTERLTRQLQQHVDQSQSEMQKAKTLFEQDLNEAKRQHQVELESLQQQLESEKSTMEKHHQQWTDQLNSQYSDEIIKVKHELSQAQQKFELETANLQQQLSVKFGSEKASLMSAFEQEQLSFNQQIQDLRSQLEQVTANSKAELEHAAQQRSKALDSLSAEHESNIIKLQSLWAHENKQALDRLQQHCEQDKTNALAESARLHQVEMSNAVKQTEDRLRAEFDSVVEQRCRSIAESSRTDAAAAHSQATSSLEQAHARALDNLRTTVSQLESQLAAEQQHTQTLMQTAKLHESDRVRMKADAERALTSALSAHKSEAQAALRAALAAARVEADAASSTAQQMREVEERKLRDALASAQEETASAMTKVRILESEVAAAQRAEKTAKSKEISATESASRAFASVAELRSQLTVAQNSMQEHDQVHQRELQRATNRLQQKLNECEGECSVLKQQVDQMNIEKNKIAEELADAVTQWRTQVDLMLKYQAEVEREKAQQQQAKTVEPSGSLTPRALNPAPAEKAVDKPAGGPRFVQGLDRQQSMQSGPTENSAFAGGFFGMFARQASRSNHSSEDAPWSLRLPIRKEGFLMKLSDHVRDSNRRFFQLRPGYLVFWTDTDPVRSVAEVRGVIRLLDATCERKDKELILRGPQILAEIVLQALTVDDAEDWRVCISMSTSS